MIPTREEFDAALRNHRFDVHSHARHFESPIEWEGHWFVEKVIKADDTRAAPAMFMGEPSYPRLAVQAVQVPIPTTLGLFYGDAVVHTPGKNTLIEYDGRAYHLDQEADDARSAAILATGLIDQIVRVEAVVLHHAPGHAAFIVSKVHAEAASPMSAGVGVSLGMDGCADAWDEQRPPSSEPFSLTYQLQVKHGYDPEYRPTTIWVHRPTRQGDRVSRMLALLDHYYVRSLQELIALHRQHHPGADRN